MITFGGFILGALLFSVGFTMVWKTDTYIRFLGDISQLFGAVGIPWLSWKVFGLVVMFSGFSIAFGLLGFIIQATVGRLFNIG